jgi:F0F1-type ATP synthase delta subunit
VSGGVKNFLLYIASRGPHSLLPNVYREYFSLVVRRLKREVDHLSTNSAVDLYIHSPIRLQSAVLN